MQTKESSGSPEEQPFISDDVRKDSFDDFQERFKLLQNLAFTNGIQTVVCMSEFEPVSCTTNTVYCFKGSAIVGIGLLRICLKRFEDWYCED